MLEYGKAAIRLSLLSDDIAKQLNAVEARMQKFGKRLISIGSKFTLVGGAIVAPFAAGMKALTDFGGTIGGISKRTGIGVQTIQSLGLAAEEAGGSLEGVGDTLRGMADFTGKVAMGNGK